MIFPIASAFFDQLADPGDRSHQAAGIQRHQYHFAVVSGANLLQRIGVFLRHEVVDRLNIARGDRRGDHLGGAGFRFGGPFACLRLQERGLPFALGLEDLRLLFPFRFQNFRLSHPFGLKDVRAFGTFGFHLGVHRGDKLRRRANVANFDSGDFHPHGLVASSTICSRRVLMLSRWESISSSSIEPSTVRMLVIVRLTIACSRLLTS